MNQTTEKLPWGLWIIGGFKLICGVSLVGLGIGLFRHVDSDPVAMLHRLVAALRLDPDNHYIHQAFSRISGISPKQLREISLGTFVYAGLYLVEATGLLLGKRWGEYFTVFATGFFIPLEIYEVYQKLTPIRTSLLVLNVAIVAYLIVQLWQRRRAKTGSESLDPVRKISII